MDLREPAPAPDLKEACVRAAREVIAEQGLEKLSLREVARRLGVSHQAPYRHYPSRDHLLAEVMRRCLQSFARGLDERPHHEDPAEDLAALGQRYLDYAARHPLEYRLMFGTPWPAPAEHPDLVRDAVHAFDVLRGVLRRLHGEAAPARVDQEALSIWSAVHGLAMLRQADAMACLQLVPGVEAAASRHLLAFVGAALHGAGPDPGGPAPA